jgi:hypothetical protein
MRVAVAALAGIVILSGCTTGKNYSAAGVDPIPGSITYQGQPRTKLTKSPIGSTFPHDFINEFGQRVEETYMIQPDRSLKIVHREIKPIRLDGRD